MGDGAVTSDVPRHPDVAIEPTFLAIYGYERSAHLADTILEVCPKPRIFETSSLAASRASAATA